MYSRNMRFQKAIAASIIFIFAIEEIAGDSTPSTASSLLRRQYQSNYDNERIESISQSVVGNNDRSLLRRRHQANNNNQQPQPQTHQHRSLADYAADFFRQHFGSNIKKIKLPSSLPRPTTQDDMNQYNGVVPTHKPTPILTAKPTRKDIGGIRPWPHLGPTKPITTNDDGAGGDANDNEETTTTTSTSAAAAAATPKPTTTQPIPTPSPTKKQIITNNATPSPTSSPTTTTTNKDDYYFPRFNIDNIISCVYGNDYPDWYENDGMLFDSMKECEDEYVVTTTTTSTSTSSTSTTASTSTTPTNSPTSKPESKPKHCYPILGSSICQCDTSYPDFMMLDTNTNEYFFSKDVCNCCSKHSCDGMDMDELGLSCPELVTTTTTSTSTTSSSSTSSSKTSTPTSTTTSSSSTTTSSSSANINEATPTSYWYPGKDDTGTKTCIYDALYPSSYLTMINTKVLFVTEEECCKKFPCRVPISKVSYWYPVTIQQPQQDEDTTDGNNWIDQCVYNNEWPDSYNNEMIMPPLLYEVESECLNYLDGI